ncbi:PHD-finger domain-containing protein [Phthorimaea operculella]|nr:PHD-finger domain-containing protein [Phthorimaea operculella]KAI5652012.1 PHD-finger domain-containing protein [Phthorimaea operculella]
MAKCAKCSKVVSKRYPGVQCNKCSKWFHGACASLTTEQLSALSTTESVDWKCSRCATTSGSKPKRISVILPDAEEDEESEKEQEVIMPKDKEDRFINEMRKESRKMREIIREIIREELNITLKFYSDKIDEYEEKMREYETRVKLMENECKNLSNKYKNLELKCGVIEQKSNKLEQAQASNDLEICGLPVLDNEDLKEKTKIVSSMLQQKSQEDIVKVYRKKIGARQASTPARAAREAADAPVVVTLRQGCKDAWLRAAKNATIYLRDLGYEVDEEHNKRIYIRAALSPTNAYLLWKAKSELREKALCKYVWYKDGNIMVRKAEGDRKIYYVRSADDIGMIRKALLK